MTLLIQPGYLAYDQKNKEAYIPNQEVAEAFRSAVKGGLFKGGTATDETIAAVYMTGILPIKKYGTESALTDFHEYTMVAPDTLAPYVGFTEQEVQDLCEK